MKIILLFFICFFMIPLSNLAQMKAANEERFISIGGIEHWITIHGYDSSKPIVLFLHGGPGSVMSAYDQTIYGEWEKDFIVVNWDQRGAGRTFGRNAPSQVDEDYWIENPLTVEQMTADGIELSEYLLKYLGQQKLMLLGTSWGSVLGLKMALHRPDLYNAYVGHSQLVDGSKALVQAYKRVLTLARTTGDREAVDQLGSIGAPPYEDAKNAGQLFRIIKKYERAHSIPAPASWWKLAPGYDNETDAQHRYDGDDYSFIHFVGHKKLGIKAMSATVDFMEEGLELKIPVYLIQGEEDILTPKETSRVYFDQIKAPKKEYFLLPGADHGHNQAVVDTQYKIVKEYLSPVTSGK